MKQRRSLLKFASVLMLFAMLFGYAPITRASGAVTVTSSASASPAKAEPGQTATITVNLNASADANTLVYLVVNDPNGGEAFSATKDNQAVAAGVPTAVSFQWTVPANAALGTYRIQTGIFGAGWAGQYEWNWQAGQMTVAEPGQGGEEPPPGGGGPVPQEPYVTEIAVTPAEVTAGTQAAITATVTTAETKQLLVDVEVYDPAGTKIYQKIFDNQTQTAGSAKSYEVAWAVPSSAVAGTYRTQVHLFGAGWSSYETAGKSADFTVKAAAEPVPAFTSLATASPAVANQGEAVTVTASLTSTIDATADVLVRLTAPSGAAVHEQTFAAQTFTAGVATALTTAWTAPADAALGTYKVAVLARKADGSVIYHTSEAAGQFTVKDPSGADPVPDLAFVGAASVTPMEAVAGSPVSLLPRITSNQDKTVLVDVEVIDPTGESVFQQVFDNTALSANVPVEFPLTWNIPATVRNGAYQVVMGVFGQGWDGIIDWLGPVGQFSVSGGTGEGPGSEGPGGEDPGEEQPSGPIQATASFLHPSIMAGNDTYIQVAATSQVDQDVLVNIEVHDSDNNKAFQRVYHLQHLTANETKQYNVRWVIPASQPGGDYTVAVSFFKPQWAEWLATFQGAAPISVAPNPDPWATPPPPPAPASLPAYPAQMPDYLSIGVTAYPDHEGLTGWMPETGIPFSYAYQYLAAGVNTADGWATWGGDDRFAYNYAFSADAHGYMPVFTYYNLLQSDGPCSGCNEAEKDLAHLNDPTLMKAYFENFIKLLKDMGPGTYNGRPGFSKPLIIHVEPDLSAYAQQAVLDSSRCYGFCSGQGNDPALLNASVASAGVPEVAGFPNTYQGFHWALLHLRDLYAPNAIMATHVSGWATMYDLGGDRDPWLDAEELGKVAGTFAALSGTQLVPAGVSTYDLVFNDVADRDAGHYASMGKQTWWDRTNLTFPNFHRWEEYIANIGQVTGKRLVIWQIPTGNQYFATMDNSYGHYQDNKVEYFYDHMQELASYGVVALLFGRGNPGSNAHWDENQNGVTNGTPFCTTAGMGHGEICNTNISTVPDDDGGYIRMRTEAYLQDPLQVR
ncbi:MAG TPA: hypothetical protein VD973_00565 [Symbiobacteriaceae bacterium]|nr:hypothetical protein [Symbiobacteriaceae bacterium]